MLSVHFEVLSCLVHLSLKDDTAPSSSSSARADAADRQAQNREKKLRQRQVKRHKGRTGALDDALLARDWAEGEATVNQQQRAKFTSTILTAVFTSYFTLLKQHNTSAEMNESMTGCAGVPSPLVVCVRYRPVPAVEW